MEASGGGQHRPPPPHGTVEWLEWLADQPLQAIPFNPAQGADFGLLSGAGILSGWTFHETSAQAGVFQILDGVDATGLLMVEFNAVASGNSQLGLPEPGVLFERGLFWHRVSGTATLRGGLQIRLER